MTIYPKNRFARPTLSGVHLFDGLSVEARESIEQLCRWREVPAGTEIVRHRDETSEVVFVIAGQARAQVIGTDGKQVDYRVIGPGGLLGELSAFDGAPRSASVVALEPCLVGVMPSSSFRAMLLAHPTVCEKFMQYLVAMARSLSERVFELSTLQVNARTQAELLRLAEKAPGRSTNVVSLDPALTIEDIANRIGARREGVSRAVSELADEGIMARHDKVLVVLNLIQLRRKVQSAIGEFNRDAG